MFQTECFVVPLFSGTAYSMDRVARRKLYNTFVSFCWSSEIIRSMWELSVFHSKILGFHETTRSLRFIKLPSFIYTSILKFVCIYILNPYSCDTLVSHVNDIWSKFARCVHFYFRYLLRFVMPSFCYLLCFPIKACCLHRPLSLLTHSYKMWHETSPSGDIKKPFSTRRKYSGPEEILSLGF